MNVENVARARVAYRENEDKREKKTVRCLYATYARTTSSTFETHNPTHQDRLKETMHMETNQQRCADCAHWTPTKFTATRPIWGRCTQDGLSSKWTAGHPFCGFERGQCTICGAPSLALGVFHPNDSQEYGAPEGKTRTFHYRLCGRCAADPGTPERIERLCEIGFKEVA